MKVILSDIQANRIELKAYQPAGLFYGIQTLRQLLPPDIFRHAPVKNIEWTVPCVSIVDYPRFQWARPAHRDPARHFIPKHDVMRYIDAMALHTVQPACKSTSPMGRDGASKSRNTPYSPKSVLAGTTQ